jgi:hypothetical protein
MLGPKPNGGPSLLTSVIYFGVSQDLCLGYFSFYLVTTLHSYSYLRFWSSLSEYLFHGLISSLFILGLWPRRYSVLTTVGFSKSHFSCIWMNESPSISSVDNYMNEKYTLKEKTKMTTNKTTSLYYMLNDVVDVTRICVTSSPSESSDVVLGDGDAYAGNIYNIV